MNATSSRYRRPTIRRRVRNLSHQYQVAGGVKRVRRDRERGYPGALIASAQTPKTIAPKMTLTTKWMNVMYAAIRVDPS